MATVQITDKRQVKIDGTPIGPRGFVVTDTVGDLEVEAVIAFEAGRYQAKSITARAKGSEPVTADALRKISIDELVGEGVFHVALHAGYFAGVTVRPDPGEGPTEANLRSLARIYRFHYAIGDHPTKAVARVMGLNRNTAARWVVLARERGLLGETEQRKAAP